MATALLNISIPLELGSLVTVVSQLQTDLPLSNYLSHLAPSALKLAALYMTQVIHYLSLHMPAFITF